ncbi:hypothetical protein KL916_005199 [Ogataea parapolymorpha]|nr:hypothetical protein KL916_005199 [Ogataea parapolymorpha]
MAKQCDFLEVPMTPKLAHPQTLQRSPNSMPSFSALGIKRPSDSVLNCARQDLATGESSGDSNGSTSRVSSITSASSTELAKIRYKIPPPRAGRVGKTLSQQEKYKLYEEMEEDDDISQEPAMFNVPMALHSTASLFEFSNKTSGSRILKQAWHDSSKLAPSPLPGALAKKSRTEPTYLPSPVLTKHHSYSNLSPDARDLSNFYEYSIQNYVEQEMNRRSKYSSKVDELDDPKLPETGGFFGAAAQNHICTAGLAVQHLPREPGAVGKRLHIFEGPGRPVLFEYPRHYQGIYHEI